MIIGIDARFYGSVGKGLGRYTAELIHALETLDQDNEYRIFLRRENFSEYEPKNPRFRKVLADFRWYSFAEQFFFPWVIRRECCDLVHFPHFNVPVAYRSPFVVTIHDLILLHFPTVRATTLNPLWYRLKFLVYRAVIHNAVYRAKRVVTVSEFTKRDILTYYSIPESSVVVSYESAYPFCLWETPESVHSLFLSLGMFSSRGILKPYALYVGNAYPHKNLDSLLDAFVAFPDPDAKLILVGREDYFYAQIKRRAHLMKAHSIVFAEAISDRQLDTLYRYARVYVFPSLYEGFGLPPIEAMAKGTPVVAARTSSLPEILGDAAYFYDPSRKGDLEEAILHVWQDESLRETLRKRGYARSALFSWDRMGVETLQVYREILTQKIQT